MMKWLGICALMLSLPLLGKSEVRMVESFNKIELEGYGVLTIKQGDTPGLIISADEDVLGKLSSTVEDNTLKIQPKERLYSKNPIDYRVTVPHLTEIEIEGAADVKSDGTLKLDELDIKIEGTTKADLNIEASEIEVKIDGAGQVTIGGMVDRQEVKIDGAGKYHAMELKSHDASIEINGAGKAQVYVTDSLDVKISGAGAIRYKGSPEVKQKIKGMGTVEHQQGS